MSAGSVVKHVIIVTVLIVMLVVIPVTSHFDFFGAAGGTDDTTGASLEVPAAPDGEFIILVNNALHADSMADWEVFFSGEDLPVIFDDIECLVASGDPAGSELAERYRIQLPENQMTVRTEDGTMLASKAEAGLVDIAIFSEAMADSLQLDPSRAADSLTIIKVKGDQISGDGSGSEEGGDAQ